MAKEASNIPANIYPIRVQVVDSSGDQISDFTSSTPPTTSNAAFTIVPSSTTAVTLLTANSDRLTGLIFNDSTAVLYVAEFPTSVATASATNASYAVAPGGLAVVTEYDGVVQGVWASVNGSARVTEH